MVRTASLHNTYRHTLRPAFRRLPLYACAVMIACLGDRIAGPNAPPSPGAVPVVHNLVESVVGCWQVSIGRWEPNMSIGEDTIFSWPPRSIELQAVKGTRTFEDHGWLVRPAPGVRPSVHDFSFFETRGSDSIDVVWTTGFSGLTMRLGRVGDTLRGQARTFWDFPRTAQTAEVLLARISCR